MTSSTLKQNRNIEPEPKFDIPFFGGAMRLACVDMTDWAVKRFWERSVACWRVLAVLPDGGLIEGEPLQWMTPSASTPQGVVCLSPITVLQESAAAKILRRYETDVVWLHEGGVKTLNWIGFAVRSGDMPQFVDRENDRGSVWLSHQQLIMLAGMVDEITFADTYPDLDWFSGKTLGTEEVRRGAVVPAPVAYHVGRVGVLVDKEKMAHFWPGILVDL